MAATRFCQLCCGGGGGEGAAAVRKVRSVGGAFVVLTVTS